MLDLRIRNTQKKERDLDSRIYTIVFPEEQEILFNQVVEQMMMDGYATFWNIVFHTRVPAFV